jgi:tetratricopeptide (TPR) repeat protein
MKALVLIRHAISLSPVDIKLHITLSKAHRMADDLTSAYTTIKFAANLFEKAAMGEDTERGPYPLPDDITLQTNLIINEMAINCAMEGDYPRSIAYFNRIIDLTPSTQIISVSISEHSRNDRIKSKSEQYERIGRQARYLVNRGDCYSALERVNDSIQDYRVAMNLLQGISEGMFMFYIPIIHRGINVDHGVNVDPYSKPRNKCKYSLYIYVVILFK